MLRRSQISAFVCRETRARLDRYVRATGEKKGHVIERALEHHLQALEELPADVIIPARVVVTRKSGEAILRRLAHPRPTRALRELMTRDGD